MLVSAVIADGPPRQLVNLVAAGRETLVTSAALIAELLDVLRRTKFGLAPEEVFAAVNVVVAMAQVVETVSR